MQGEHTYFCVSIIKTKVVPANTGTLGASGVQRQLRGVSSRTKLPHGSGFQESYFDHRHERCCSKQCAFRSECWNSLSPLARKNFHRCCITMTSQFLVFFSLTTFSIGPLNIMGRKGFKCSSPQVDLRAFFVSVHQGLHGVRDHGQRDHSCPL